MPSSGTGYSMPGDVLWYRYFNPGDFTVRVYEDSVDTWWQFPPDCPEDPIPRTCYQYNFVIDPRNAFFQHGSRENPVVYWLDVQAEPNDPDAMALASVDPDGLPNVRMVLLKEIFSQTESMKSIVFLVRCPNQEANSSFTDRAEWEKPWLPRCLSA